MTVPANSSSSEVIVAQELSKWFGEVVALNNLDATIGPGVTGLLGPNGAGKSTFIKAALGLYKPSRGTLLVYGEPPRNNIDVLRRIGYCAESDKFPENVSGYEFVYWAARLWGMDAATASRAAEEACARVRMDHRMDDLIEEYSRGMRQRIKIAQAMATNPDLLFLDEPMAGLDPQGREETFALIRQLGEEGRTVLFSSHILHEIERVTNQVMVLHNGRMLARGQVRQIRELIDEHPHAVTVQCNAPHRLSTFFVEDESTLHMEFHEKSVTIRTRDPNSFYQKLNGIVMDGAVQVDSITCPDDNLQSVFQYLVE